MKETLKTFENIQDPFNPDNYLTGQINITQGDNYGQLLLTQINGKECSPQVIYSTPKMHYPFNKNNEFYFGYLENSAPAYHKLDGTNIIAYRYIFNGEEFITYKTRLNPVLGHNKFGNFLFMWKEMLQRYPNIPQLTEKYNLSFELYGILNKHLVLYPVRLDMRLLFALDRQTGKIILPEVFSDSLPVVEKYCNFDIKQLFSVQYGKVKEDIEKCNNYLSDTEVEGLEGCVIYIKNNNSELCQWKLKPETIFKLHTAAGMSKTDIMITCYNALENVDIEDLTYEFVILLLSEEFSEREILRNELRIKFIIKEVKEEIKKRFKIIEVYTQIGLKISEDKRTVMRKMSEYFRKQDMRYVYAIVSAYEH